jgi:thiamine-monophosphate kinase
MSVKPAEKEFLRRLLSDLGAEENDVVYVDGLALKIDGSAASTSKLPFQSWFDFGWRNVAGAYSDMRVKYAEARHLLASVTAPDLATAEEVIAGIKAAASYFSLAYLGGDLNQGGEVVVDVVLVGRATHRWDASRGPATSSSPYRSSATRASHIGSGERNTQL